MKYMLLKSDRSMHFSIGVRFIPFNPLVYSA